MYFKRGFESPGTRRWMRMHVDMSIHMNWGREVNVCRHPFMHVFLNGIKSF